MPDEVKKENKKGSRFLNLFAILCFVFIQRRCSFAEKQAAKENSLSREDRIRAMGPNALTMIKRNTEMKIKQFQTKVGPV